MKAGERMHGFAVAAGSVAKCGCCYGTGLRMLNKRELQTRAEVPSWWIDTADVKVTHPRIKLTTLAERLRRLAALGVIETRKRPGHRGIRQWRAKMPGRGIDEE